MWRNFIIFVSSACGLPRVLAVPIGVKLPHKSWTPPYRIQANFHLRGAEEKEEKEKEKKERKKKEKKEKRRFSQWWMWRINISFFITFWVFCWLDLEFKGCFVFKYFSPRRHYVLNLPNCSISHDFFWGSCTFSFYGSLVVKIFTFLWLQEFWELPKGCHSFLIKFRFPM